MASLYVLLEVYHAFACIDCENKISFSSVIGLRLSSLRMSPMLHEFDTPGHLRHDWCIFINC